MAEEGTRVKDCEIRAMAVAMMQLLDFNDALMRRYDGDDASEESYANVTAAARACKVLNSGLAKVFEWDEQDLYEQLYSSLLDYADEKGVIISESMDLFLYGMAYGFDEPTEGR